MKRAREEDETMPASEQANVGLFAQSASVPSGLDRLLDAGRLQTLESKVKALMVDGAWRTFAEIQAVTGGSEAGISATLRKLRQPPHRLTVEKHRRGDPAAGLWAYRVRKGAA